MAKLSALFNTVVGRATLFADDSKIDIEVLHGQRLNKTIKYYQRRIILTFLNYPLYSKKTPVYSRKFQFIT